MRIKFTRRIICLILLLVIFSTLYCLRQIGLFLENSNKSLNFLKKTHAVKPTENHISKLVTIVIRQIEPGENSATSTVNSFLKIFPGIKILLVFYVAPYPPLKFTQGPYDATYKNVKTLVLGPKLRQNHAEAQPLKQIDTKYVLFVPDGTEIRSRHPIQLLHNSSFKNDGVIVSSPVGGYKNVNCLKMHVSSRDWALKYSLAAANSQFCDGISGKHVVFMNSQMVRRLPDAFLAPFPDSLYVQSTALNIKVLLIKNEVFHDAGPRKNHYTTLKQKQLHKERLRYLYKKLSIKKVTRETGVTEWYGCTKNTPRCFPQVLNSMPSYLFEEKWTPPCCLQNLKVTARYVFGVLEETGVRFWLENGSLLGAMRNGDILPWDHDVDLGFMRDDLDRCVWLKKASYRPAVDPKGFLWEKATEGNFYRVYFSKINKIHVNLFPFYNNNGTITRDRWITNHQNMDFRDNFLHPMSSIDFIGISVPSPNNIRDFLELKYGKGCIEKPRYPDSKVLTFP